MANARPCRKIIGTARPDVRRTSSGCKRDLVVSGQIQSYLDQKEAANVPDG